MIATLARAHAARLQQVREAARGAIQRAEGVRLVRRVGAGDAHRDAARGVPLQAFVRDVQALGRAVEERPELLPRAVPVGVRVAREVGQARCTRCWGGLRAG
jgi:hypothetical protein